MLNPEEEISLSDIGTLEAFNFAKEGGETFFLCILTSRLMDGEGAATVGEIWARDDCLYFAEVMSRLCR